MARDWVQWHRDYDQPTSSLAQRLIVVQRDLRQALSAARAREPGELREWFADCGFTELSFTMPMDALFRVGMHQLEHASDRPATPGVRMFCFL